MIDKCLTVIVPIYNGELFLNKCLDSLVNQTYKELEIILINDGSIDNSLQICEEYKSRDNRIKIYSQENKGASSARNLGLKYATGEYVTFLDCDDWLELDAYEFLIEFLVKYKLDIIIHPFIFERKIGKTKWVDSDEKIFLNSEMAIKEMFIGKIFAGHVNNKIFKTDILKHNLFDEKIYIYEDNLSMYGCFRDAIKILWVNKHVYHYLMNENSLMHKKFNEKINTGKISADNLKEKISNEMPHLVPYAEMSRIRIYRDILSRAYKGKYIGFKKNYSEFKFAFETMSEQGLRLLNVREQRNLKVLSSNIYIYILYKCIEMICKKFKYYLKLYR